MTASLRQMLDGCSYATLKEWGLLKICPRWLVAAVETNELVRVRCCVARRSPVAAHVSSGVRWDPRWCTIGSARSELSTTLCAAQGDGRVGGERDEK